MRRKEASRGSGERTDTHKQMRSLTSIQSAAITGSEEEAAKRFGKRFGSRAAAGTPRLLITRTELKESSFSLRCPPVLNTARSKTLALMEIQLNQQTSNPRTRLARFWLRNQWCQRSRKPHSMSIQLLAIVFLHQLTKPCLNAPLTVSWWPTS